MTSPLKAASRFLPQLPNLTFSAGLSSGRALLAGLGFGMLLTSAAASTILYESFDYSPGVIAGQNGGTGFSGAWLGTGSVAAPGLTSGNLTTSGNLLLGTSSHNIRRAFDATGLTDDGSKLWFSVLFSAPDTTTGTAAALPSFFSDLTSSNAQDQGFTFTFNAKSSTSAYIDIRIGGSIRSSTTVTSTNYYAETQLFLGRITFSDTSNQDRIELWMNPSLSSTVDTLESPLLSGFGQWNDTGSNNAFRYNKYDGPDRTIDEIRLATTLAEAIPVPEPAAAPALIGLAAIITVHCRRRSREPKTFRF